MLIDTKKENLCINQVVTQKDTIVNVEGDVIIPDIKPDILNSVNTSGNICVYKKEIMDGKLKLEGGIYIDIMYMPDGEASTVRGLNTNLDFNEILNIEELRENMTTQEDINIKTIECRVLNGRKINIKVTMQIKTKIFSKENIDLIKEIDNNKNIQVLSKMCNLYSIVGEGENKIYAKDTIRIDEIDNLAEILKTDFKIINKEIKVSYNKVLAKSDLRVKIIYLTEDNRINSVEYNIPVMGFVDIQNISEENICDTRYSIKNIIIKPNSVEEHSIYVEVQINIYCTAYETKEFKVIEDLYSTKEDIEINKNTVNTVTGKSVVTDICKISESLQIPELGNNRIYNVDIRPRILSENLLNDKIVYEGEIEIDFLFEADNIIKVDSKKFNINFNFEMTTKNSNPQDKLETMIEIKQNDFIVQNDGNIECTIGLQMEANIVSTNTINVIDEINTGELLPSSDYSMIIYFVKSDDSLWNIAKKLHSTVEDIVKVNEIEDNKIYPGMQLFVPKYSNRKLA